jgi:hypothetical protein
MKMAVPCSKFGYGKKKKSRNNMRDRNKENIGRNGNFLLLSSSDTKKEWDRSMSSRSPLITPFASKNNMLVAVTKKPLSENSVYMKSRRRR